jgi:hypothetical protein
LDTGTPAPMAFSLRTLKQDFLGTVPAKIHLDLVSRHYKPNTWIQEPVWKYLRLNQAVNILKSLSVLLMQIHSAFKILHFILFSW